MNWGACQRELQFDQNQRLPRRGTEAQEKCVWSGENWWTDPGRRNTATMNAGIAGALQTRTNGGTDACTVVFSCVQEYRLPNS